MNRPLIISAIFLFIFWLLPLGIFIKPSSEKLACGGQRAICLCHTQVKTHKAVDAGKTFANSGGHEEANSSGGGFHYLFCALSFDADENAVRLFEFPQRIPSTISLHTIEPVPKA